MDAVTSRGFAPDAPDMLRLRGGGKVAPCLILVTTPFFKQIWRVIFEISILNSCVFSFFFNNGKMCVFNYYKKSIINY